MAGYDLEERSSRPIVRSLEKGPISCCSRCHRMAPSARWDQTSTTTACLGRLRSWVNRRRPADPSTGFAGTCSRPKARSKGRRPRREISAPAYGSYPLACLIVGAALDAALRHRLPRVCARLLEWQDPETGGLWHRWNERTAEGEQEIFPTAQAGMTLRSGRADRGGAQGRPVVSAAARIAA